LERKPLAGMDLLTSLSRQLHASQELIRMRASRNPNELIEAEATMGERVADQVARFGGSWTFIITFGVLMTIYTTINILLGAKAWDAYPFILLNLFLSMLAALQAPVIMMSQNRQDTKDRLRGELDFDVNRRAASDIQGLARKLNRHNAAPPGNGCAPAMSRPVRSSAKLNSAPTRVIQFHCKNSRVLQIRGSLFDQSRLEGNSHPVAALFHIYARKPIVAAVILTVFHSLLDCLSSHDGRVAINTYVQVGNLP
jgi:uncharacterized membrane protein